MAVLRALTHEEFADIRAKGVAFTENFIQQRVKQIAAAKVVSQKAGLLRDKLAAAKIGEKIQNGDVVGMTMLLNRLETALLQQRETEDSILKKSSYYYTDQEIIDQANRPDQFGRLKMMSAHKASLHLTAAQRSRLDQHDPAKPIELKLRRMLRMNAKQGMATLNMHLGLIGHDGCQHATPHELGMRNKQKKRWRKFGESIALTRDNESVSMLDVMKSASKKKLAETYALTKGLESYAKAAGLSWAFLTLTAPPRMHCNPKNGQNTWDGTTPDQAHNWIANAWNRAESRLRKKKIILPGLRVVEPHRDGCPHWHMLVFAHAADMATIESAFRYQPEWKSEQGMKFIVNDGRATAASYCFKYLLKTINSVEELHGEQGTVDAWRSTWGIRSFQFFGLPAKSLWRNLRAVKECPAEPLLAGLWRAAHRGDGHAFIGLAGGLNVKSKDRPVVSRTTSDNQTKSIEFILTETAESIKFDFVKWQQTRKNIENAKVEVIPNYPRKSKAQTLTDALLATCPPSAGRGGNDSLHDHPDEGRECLIRGFPCPSSLPTLSPVGIAKLQV